MKPTEKEMMHIESMLSWDIRDFTLGDAESKFETMKGMLKTVFHNWQHAAERLEEAKKWTRTVDAIDIWRSRGIERPDILSHLVSAAPQAQKWVQPDGSMQFIPMPAGDGVVPTVKVTWEKMKDERFKACKKLGILIDDWYKKADGGDREVMEVSNFGPAVFTVITRVKQHGHDVSHFWLDVFAWRPDSDFDVNDNWLTDISFEDLMPDNPWLAPLNMNNNKGEGQ